MRDLVKQLHDAAYWETHIRKGVRKNPDIGPENTLFYKAAMAITSLMNKPEPVKPAEETKMKNKSLTQPVIDTKITK